jgi:hypothetical protein
MKNEKIFDYKNFPRNIEIKNKRQIKSVNILLINFKKIKYMILDYKRKNIWINLK